MLLGGWASRNKYSLIGGFRAAAQQVSYEVPMVLAAMGVVMLAGSMKLSAIVEAQSGVWNIVTQPLAFIIFFIAVLAELNRIPFDLPEAESELVGGFNIEYSSMRFALFFVAEYANVFTLSLLTTLLFLGGWNGPLLPGIVWLLLKTYVLVFVIIWVRATLPRVRVDQLMTLRLEAHAAGSARQRRASPRSGIFTSVWRAHRARSSSQRPRSSGSCRSSAVRAGESARAEAAAVRRGRWAHDRHRQGHGHDAASTSSRPAITEQYPYVKRELPERSRMSFALPRDESGTPMCKAARCARSRAPTSASRSSPRSARTHRAACSRSSRSTWAAACTAASASRTAPRWGSRHTGDFENASPWREDMILVLFEGRVGHAASKAVTPK